jgi:hypothetical protein
MTLTPILNNHLYLILICYNRKHKCQQRRIKEYYLRTAGDWTPLASSNGFWNKDSRLFSLSFSPSTHHSLSTLTSPSLPSLPSSPPLHPHFPLTTLTPIPSPSLPQLTISCVCYLGVRVHSRRWTDRGFRSCEKESDAHWGEESIRRGS